MSVAFTICDSVTGRPDRAGLMATEADAARQVRDGEALYLGVLSKTQYLVDGEPVEMPTKPSIAHEWDWPTHTWIENLDTVRAAALERIEFERVARTTAVIEHEGVLVDADSTAQGNVTAKLQEIGQCRALGLAMPAELMFWRDAGNTTHTFDTLDAYADWLGRLAIAITRRGTEVYSWAWQQKTALGQASTLAAITAIPSSDDTTESINP